MIAFIKGTVASYGVDWVIVDCNGMGYYIAYPHTDEISLNKEVMIHTYMHISENDIGLFGFSSLEEKELFLRLISVKGLGPKTAMNMLGKAGYDTIVAAIEEGNVTALKKLPGIGAKSASQIVLDLKGKLVPTNTASSAKPSQDYPPEIKDALEGLKNLGYRPNELGSVANMMKEKPGLTVEQYVKLGLQFLMRQKLGG